MAIVHNKRVFVFLNMQYLIIYRHIDMDSYITNVQCKRLDISKNRESDTEVEPERI